MRIFVTGASGWVGVAVVPELLSVGHTVVGLARSDRSAEVLSRLGAQVHRGDLEDVETLRTGAADAEAVIHLAFEHDIAHTGGFDQAALADRGAIEAMGSVLTGTRRPLIMVTATGALPPGRLATEEDDPVPTHPLYSRFLNEQVALSMAGQGVRSSVVRLAPSVHGTGDPVFMAAMVRIAREKGFSGFIGDGSNRLPAVHQKDAATLFRLAVENAPAGSILHAVDDEGVPFRDIAETIGRKLDVPVRSVSPEDAHAHFDWWANIMSFDIPASSAITRQLLGWEPSHGGLIADLAEDHYYAQ